MEQQQRQLEIELNRLRRAQLYNEKRIQGLEAKEKQQEGALKRKRDDELEEVEAKKLRSVVTTVDERSPSPERKPQLRASVQDDRRNRRLFGLLQGTLARFSEEKKVEERNERIRARMEVEKEIDTRIDIAREQTLQKDRERLQKEKEDLLAKQLDINKLVEEKAKELENVRREYYESLLSRFGKTEGVSPALYFLPAKLDDWTEKEFGIKTPEIQVEKKESSDGAGVRVTTADGDEDLVDKDEVEIAENDKVENDEKNTEANSETTANDSNQRKSTSSSGSDEEK